MEATPDGIAAGRRVLPAMTRSMHIAIEDLALDHLALIYPGPRRFRIAPRVIAVPAAELAAPAWGPSRRSG